MGTWALGHLKDGCLITDRHESLEHELITWEPRLADLKKKIQAKPERRVKVSAVEPGPKNRRRGMNRVQTAAARPRSFTM